EFTYRETAESLDISIKTVENHMGLALKDIRAALKEFKPET
ncbi:MAG: sigma factor-like helix-turn-helix DNA-binding protein, partial [Candidatus Halalkalibacterium sp. M3_1C_030]